MCDCIEKTNEAIREMNAVLVTNLLGHPRATVSLCKRQEKKRGRLPILQASFCPFCGEEYSEMQKMTENFVGQTEE